MQNRLTHNTWGAGRGATASPDGGWWRHGPFYTLVLVAQIPDVDSFSTKPKCRFTKSMSASRPHTQHGVMVQVAFRRQMRIERFEHVRRYVAVRCAQRTVVDVLHTAIFRLRVRNAT